MKTLLLLALLMQQREKGLPEMGAVIDADKEARAAGKLLLANDVVRVFEVDLPAGMKELNFAPVYGMSKGEFFVVGGRRVIWLDGPVTLRGKALHVQIVPSISAKPFATKQEVLFENSHVRVRHMGRGEGGELKWLPKERVLLLKQGPDRIRVELKF